ncbi:LysR family transcriptional regulator [Streptomyces sp. Rer75]|uniref:LysR family transcriptional regulator n=1 Tax=unclassified Streptomyces TaxID=2593676 RepID=UPI0015CFC12F|nr:LysR family transcriptional regulator [Streptomyces sp. Rer75]QLH24707.1 LysR family transcriptional regulator [Streptomyces sp. Rer75]
MSLRQMEYLVTVVEEASFTRAAELLGVTQSALSHQIKALEREAGGPLLERLPRGVRLTPMGRAFLPHAELAVRSAGRAWRAAHAAAGAEGGELHLATLHALAYGVLPGLFARWRRERPGMRLVVHEYATGEELRDAMEHGVADLAVGHRPKGWPGPVVSLGEEEVVAVVAPDDPLAGRPVVRLADLADRDWVRCALEPVVDGRRFLDLACERAGFTPRTAVDTEHSSTAVSMAAAGVGVLISAAHAATRQDCVTLPLDPPWRREVTAFSRVRLTGAAAAFVTLLGRAGCQGVTLKSSDHPASTSSDE